MGLKCISNCSLTVTILIVIIILVVLISLYFIIKYGRNQYNQSFKEYCLANAKYSDYPNPPSTLPSSPTYNYDLSQYLWTICLNVDASNCPNLGPIPKPPGYTSKLIKGIDSNGVQRMVAHYFISNNSVYPNIIAFTGSSYLNEWYVDFNYPQIPGEQLNNYKKGVDVHRGFYDLYMSCRNELWNIYNSNSVMQNSNLSPSDSASQNQLIITGHSLGGALATICAFDFAGTSPIVYTFAAPRSGNDIYAKLNDNLNPYFLRVFNSEDVVPTLPPPIFGKYIYEHVGIPITFTSNLGSVSRNHIQSYTYFMPKSVI